MTPEAMRPSRGTWKSRSSFGIREGEGNLRPIARFPLLAREDPRMRRPTSHPAAAVTGARAAGNPNGISSGARPPGRGCRRAAAPAPRPAGAVPADVDPVVHSRPIALYERLLKDYPSTRTADKVSIRWRVRTTSWVGRRGHATMERMIRANPHSEHYSKWQFKARPSTSFPQAISRCRECYSAVIQPWTSALVLSSSPLQARLDVLQAGSLRGGPAKT